MNQNPLESHNVDGSSPETGILQELSRSRAELKAIYDAAPVMMCVIDENRRVLFANPAFTRFTGVSEEKLLGGSACGVFGCINALEDPRGCGFGSQCPACTLLEAIEDTFASGVGHQNIEYSTTILHDTRSTDVYMLGSTALIASSEQRRLILCLIDVTDRTKAELKVQSLLHEKAILLKEAHHRIKNNMNMIKSLLSLQAMQEDEGACKDALNTAAGRVHSMMVLYDKLYQAEHQHELSINIFLEPLVKEILNTFDQVPAIKSDIHIEEITIKAQLLAPLAIIVNELITNSIKHAFKTVPEPRISLTATKQVKTVIIEYRDNGPGLTAEGVKNSRAGFGMQLIEMLVDQVNGNMEIKHSDETKIIVRFDV